MGAHERQLRSVWPALAALALLFGAALWGLARDRSPGTLNNVAFAALHIAVLLSGVWAALLPRRAAAARAEDERPPAARRERVAA